MVNLCTMGRPLVDTYLRRFQKNARLANHIKNLKKVKPQELEEILKKKEEFAHQVSQKWQRSNL